VSSSPLSQSTPAFRTALGAALISALLTGAVVWAGTARALREVRERARQELGTLAEVVASSAAAPLSLGLPAETGESLASLGLHPDVRAAAVYTAKGRLHAAYVRPGLPADHPLPAAPGASNARGGRTRAGTGLVTVREVRFAGESVGTICIETGPESLDAFAAQHLRRAVSTLLFVSALSFLLGYGLQRLLLGPGAPDRPELESAGVALARAERRARQVESELADQRKRLESAIRSRTTELVKANEELVYARELSEAAARAKSEFLAHMSHEIRTPMNAVVGISRVLRDSDLDEDQRALVERIVRSGEGLVRMVDDILDFSKIEAGKLELERAEFSLRETIEEVADLMAQAAQEKGLEIATYVAGDLPARVLGDPSRLRQILLNYASNAVKFTSRGQVTLEAYADEDAQDAVRFLVRDSGIGITPERLTGLFESFRQAEPSTSRMYGGTGLGLAIAKQLAELMGGSTGAASRPGAGSTFWCSLAFEPARSSATGESAAAPAAPFAGADVVLFEGDAVVGDLLRAQLEDLGCRVRAAHSISDGLELLLSGPCGDVVLLDRGLPGSESLAETLRSHERLAELPIVSLVEPFRPRLEENGGEVAGEVARVRKPVRRDALISALAVALGTDLGHSPAAGRVEQPRAVLLETRIRQRAHILLVEDNFTNQQLVQHVLAQRGYLPILAVDGREAVDWFRERPLDLVLMDCQMPEMDGYEAARAMRRLEEGSGRRVPIVAMTASAVPEDRDRCMEAGMDDFVSKPVAPRALIETVESWLARSPELREAPKKGESAERDARDGGAGAILDAAILRDLVEDEEGLAIARDLLRGFLDEGPSGVDEVSRAAGDGAWERCARTAHSLVTTSGNVGALRLAGLLRRLESACGDRPEESVPALLERVRRELDEVLAALEGLRPEVGL